MGNIPKRGLLCVIYIERIKARSKEIMSNVLNYLRVWV